MVSILIVHGLSGSPNGNWFPWLKQELEKLGHKVIVPQFPTPENQNLESWLDTLESYKIDFDNNSIVIGHSLGVSFLLTVLEQIEIKIKSAFFVSGFVGLLGNKELDEVNKPICDVIFDWKLILRHCSAFHVYHSENDPYVPIAKANYLGKHLDIKPVIIKDAGHFNTDSGYTEFRLLLEDIKKEL